MIRFGIFDVQLVMVIGKTVFFMRRSCGNGLVRRAFLGHAGGFCLGALPWPAVAASGEGRFGSLQFTAYRNGDRLGVHRVDVSGSDERLQVDIEIAFDVKLAFIPLYRYRHINRELWQGGRLISLDSETDDNGDRFRVKARAERDRLLVDGSAGRLDLPGDTFSTSYWNEAAMGKGEWLGTQEGKLLRSTVTQKPAEAVQLPGQTQMANSYDLKGDLTCSLWYAGGRWVKLLFFTEDGSEIAYQLDALKQG